LRIETRNSKLIVIKGRLQRPLFKKGDLGGFSNDSKKSLLAIDWKLETGS
jgi:hypothetical protein